MSAFLIAAEVAALVVVLALAGRAILQGTFGPMTAAHIDIWCQIAAGTIVLLVSLVLLRQVGPSLAAVGFVAAIGGWLEIRHRRTGALVAAQMPLWWERLAVLLLLTTIVASPLADDYRGWDARSIWFYHAKIIFYDGLDPQTWSYVAREAAFSHPYYPKLIPALGGAVAWLVGHWNDYLPKLALAILLVPALLLCSGLFADWRCRALYWTFTLVMIRHNLVNGFMDGPLAVWSTVALLHVLAALLGAISRVRALVVVSVALSVCASLKVEGWVIAASFAGGLTLGDAILARSAFLRTDFATWAKALAFVAVPVLLWRLYCWQAGVGSGWGSFSAEYLARALVRLSSGEDVAAILHGMFGWRTLVSLGVLTAVMIALRGAGGVWWRACIVGILIVALYWAALIFAYLGTPHDLEGQLGNSISRTMLPLRSWILALILAGFSIWIGAWRAQTAR